MRELCEVPEEKVRVEDITSPEHGIEAMEELLKQVKDRFPVLEKSLETLKKVHSEKERLEMIIKELLERISGLEDELESNQNEI